MGKKLSYVISVIQLDFMMGIYGLVQYALKKLKIL